LVLFGLIAVLLGVGALLVGLLNLVLPFVDELVPPAARGSQDLSTALMGFLTYAIIAGVLIWAGVGSVRKRRWVPAVMLVLAWSWLLFGGCAVLLAAFFLDEMLLLAGPGAAPLPPELARIVTVVVLGSLALGGIALPALYVWIYRDPQLQITCLRNDPRPSWSDGLPRPVLGLSLVLWAAAILTIPMALRPVVPLFGLLVTGAWGVLLTLAGAGITALLALGIRRRSSAAWWATTVLLVLLGLSVALTAHRADPAELTGALGFPEVPTASGSPAGSVARLAVVWASIAVTLLSVLYMAAIHRHFVGRGEPGDQT
jgi:hypothetical protein